MKEKVYKVRCCWEYIQDPNEVECENCKESVKFNDVVDIAITDRATPQVCVIRQDDKYGVYTLDHTNGFGGPGTCAVRLSIRSLMMK